MRHPAEAGHVEVRSRREMRAEADRDAVDELDAHVVWKDRLEDGNGEEREREKMFRVSIGVRD